MVIEVLSMAPFATMELLSLGQSETPKDYGDATEFRTVMKDTNITGLNACSSANRSN
jgi:hypothetical protein